MTGSLTVKNGKYYAILNVYENGKRKKKWICSDLPEKGNKRRAEQFLREMLAEYERMAGIVKSDVLFSDYVRIWLEQIGRKVDCVTLQGYQVLADGHILPYFDDAKIQLVDLDYKKNNVILIQSTRVVGSTETEDYPLGLLNSIKISSIKR